MLVSVCAADEKKYDAPPVKGDAPAAKGAPASSAPTAAADNAPAPSPGGLFGPGYDPTRPPPVDPVPSGPGIVEAKAVAAGAASIEGIPEHSPGGSEPLFGVLLDVALAAGTTTQPLRTTSVTAQPKAGAAAGLFAVCVPGAEEPLTVFHGAGGKIAGFNVAVDGQIVTCSGRNGRMLLEVGEGGMLLTTAPGASWKGQLLLLFPEKGERPQRVVLPGVTVDLPLPKS